MSYVSRTEREMIRLHFSFSPVVKSLYPGKEAREELAWDLALYYNDALFATEEEPITVQHNGRNLQLFPTRKDDRKIRVQVIK